MSFGLSNIIRSSAVLFVLGLAALIGIVQFDKGYITFSGIEYHSVHYWFLNYSHGLINRGLLGTLFRFFTAGTNPVDAVKLIPPVYYFFFLISIFQLTILAPLVLRGRNLSLYLATLFIAVCSQAFGVLGFTVGYPDLICFVLLTFALLAYLRNWVSLAITINCLGPLIHEAYVFMALPLLVLSFSTAREARSRKHWIWVAPIVMGALVHIFDSPDRAIQSLAGAPISEVGMSYLQNYGLRQSFGLTTATILDMYMKSDLPWLLFLTNLIPVILFLAAVYLGRRSSGRELMLIAVCAVLPLSIMIFGWDSFRFLIFAQLAMVHLAIWLTFNADENSPASFRRIAILPALCSIIFLFEPVAVFTANQSVLSKNLELICRSSTPRMCSGEIDRAIRRHYIANLVEVCEGCR